MDVRAAWDTASGCRQLICKGLMEPIPDSGPAQRRGELRASWQKKGERRLRSVRASTSFG